MWQGVTEGVERFLKGLFTWVSEKGFVLFPSILLTLSGFGLLAVCTVDSTQLVGY